jgi:uncharacterized protein YjdB
VLDAVALDFTNVGPPYDQDFTATQLNNPDDIFGAVSNNTGVATVVPGFTPGTFVVTPVAAGKTTITVTGLRGSTASLKITVTLTSIGIH